MGSLQGHQWCQCRDKNGPSTSAVCDRFQSMNVNRVLRCYALLHRQLSASEHTQIQEAPCQLTQHIACLTLWWMSKILKK
jgi:hypothetical protein